MVSTGSVSATGCALSTGEDSTNCFLDNFIPVFGVDYYLAWRRVKHNLGTVFPKSYPGITLYIGGKFSEYFGLEIGGDISARKTKSWVIPAGSSIGGVTTSRTITGSTSVRYLGGHIDLLGYWPINCFINGFELLGAIGYGNISGFRLGVGGNYFLTKTIGVRVKFGYEKNTNQRVTGDTFYTNVGFGNRPYKYSTSLSLGAFFKF